MLLGHKISDRVAEMRDLPKGIDQRSASRHPDWTGPDDLEIKIHELREITDWEKPIFVKVGATRTYYDVQLAVKAGADVIVVDGMQGGTAATQDVFIEHVGIPTLPATRLAVDALQELGMHRQVQLIVSGGIRTGADVAKALALGADAVSIGTAALIAMGDNSPEHDEEYREIGSAAGFYDDYQAGRDPAGISTQDDELAARFDPVLGGRSIANYLRVLTLETQTLARACGKSHVHNLEPEDLVALTVEAAAMARVPLAGTDWIPGREQVGLAMVTGLTLHLERVLPAPCAVVFEACAEPEQLAKWSGTTDFTAPSVELDLRVGGRYRIAMQPPEGELFYLTGEFRAGRCLPTASRTCFDGRIPTLTIRRHWSRSHCESVGESTELTLDQGPFATQARYELHRAGWDRHASSDSTSS